jgi:hypothetical protein
MGDDVQQLAYFGAEFVFFGGGAVLFAHMVSS